MSQYLNRQVYDRMLSWKKNPEHSTLEVSGARQVGKTYIVNRDVNLHYSIYIDAISAF
jgi:hypothetical protein